MALRKGKLNRDKPRSLTLKIPKFPDLSDMVDSPTIVENYVDRDLVVVWDFLTRITRMNASVRLLNTMQDEVRGTLGLTAETFCTFLCELGQPEIGFIDVSTDQLSPAHKRAACLGQIYKKLTFEFKQLQAVTNPIHLPVAPSVAPMVQTEESSARYPITSPSPTVERVNDETESRASGAPAGSSKPLPKGRR